MRVYHIESATWPIEREPVRIELVGTAYIPAVICDVCGATWGDDFVSLCQVPAESSLRPELTLWPIPRKEQEILVRKVREELSGTCELPDPVIPGTRLGPQVVRFNRPYFPDFMWTPFIPLVRRRVLEVFEAEKVTGYATQEVIVKSVRSRKRPQAAEVPAICELVAVGGTALPPGTKIYYGCHACHEGGRASSTTWDGSDIFIDRSQSLKILITERVKDIIEREQFENCMIRYAGEITSRP